MVLVWFCKAGLAKYQARSTDNLDKDSVADHGFGLVLQGTL